MYSVSWLSMPIVTTVSSTVSHTFATLMEAEVNGCALHTRALDPAWDIMAAHVTVGRQQKDTRKQVARTHSRLKGTRASAAADMVLPPAGALCGRGGRLL
jgi:hypothetical protein